MQIKNYQQKALDRFQLWVDELKSARLKSGNIEKIMKEQGMDFPASLKDYPLTAWNSLKEKKLIPPVSKRREEIFYPEYVRRTGANGAPIPHVCLKIPTGGGKTLLGVSSLRFLLQNTGFVLWIVPTKAIYGQTVKAFRTREHPYRQILDNISLGSFKLFEKKDAFTKQDLENRLCMMTLMLPSANRQKNKGFLKIFRDSGAYSSFFPDPDDIVKNRKLMESSPDLEKNETGDWIKHSLINTLKRIRPIVVLDEAHKAYGKDDKHSKEFVKSVNRLNPRFVLELSATPKAHISNVLVHISGLELKSEEMIKLPVEIHNFSHSDWKRTLAETQKKREELEKEALRIQLKENRYIRPIALVRVEQTGKAQIGKRGRIHAQDVKEHLIKNLAVPEDHIRIQSSEEKGLAGENLTGGESQVRWIITRDALKEGWDCPFAYILALLDNTRANTALTQMAGRVLRQPQARQVATEAHPLNRCYIYLFNKKTTEAVQKVKESLETEGLTDIGNFFHTYDSQSEETKTITLRRRKKHRNLKIFLPQVLHKKGKRHQLIDYDRHILGALDWGGITGGPAISQDETATLQETQITLGLQGEKEITTRELQTIESLSADYFVRQLEDLIPNPWQSARIVEDFLAKHRKKSFDNARFFNKRTVMLEILRKRIKKETDLKAEAVFREKVRKGDIRFQLEADEKLNYEVERSFSITVPVKSRTLQGEMGREIQQSLFEPVFERAFDTEIEKNAAIYLDKSNAIHWWHRIAARQDYSLQGWRRHRVYPDFLAYRKSNNKLFIIELKGDQFKGNPDTLYKESLLKKLEGVYKSAHDRGEMKTGRPRAVLRMMFEDSCREDLNLMIKE